MALALKELGEKLFVRNSAVPLRQIPVSHKVSLSKIAGRLALAAKHGLYLNSLKSNNHGAKTAPSKSTGIAEEVLINKIVETMAEALAGLGDGACIMIAGMGPGIPSSLIDALLATKARDLTLVSNGTGSIASILETGRVRKLICSFPRSLNGDAFEKQWRSGKLELEISPQGTLSERVRAGGAGIGGFYTRTAAGTPIAEGKEVRLIDGESYVLEKPIKADFAFIRAHLADRWGNLTYRKAARNWNPSMAMAANVTVAEVNQVVSLGDIDPDAVVTPGIFVHRVIEVGEAAWTAR